VHAATVLQGDTIIGAGAVIGPNTHLVDAVIEAGAQVRSSVVSGVVVAAGTIVGPFEHRTVDNDTT
jgi:bifunctional UDP-N-acetylglucosamine pyrophosphorylase/glucosamine-1-phosphate N-acetyltransferase